MPSVETRNPGWSQSDEAKGSKSRCVCPVDIPSSQPGPPPCQSAPDRQALAQGWHRGRADEETNTRQAGATTVVFTERARCPERGRTVFNTGAVAF